jgi:3-oxoacyl-[acyl-carrier-protein] synthase-3
MAIAGSGHFVPEQVLTNADFARRLDTSDEWIRTRTGIHERRIANPQECTSTMAVAASQRALADAGMDAKDVELIICATVTPDVHLPATASFIQAGLGLNDIPMMDLVAACSGFIYGLSTAASLIEAGLYERVLLVCSETMTRMVDMDDRRCCVLFGDGAGAMVLTPQQRPEQQLLYSELGGDGGRAKMLWIPAGGSREPTTMRTINEKLHFLKMEGREVYKFAVTKMEEVTTRALEHTGLTADQLAMCIPHQSNSRIIESARQRLGLPEEKMYVNIDRLGNTSAASIPIAYDELRQAGRLGPGDYVLFVAFGAGLTWASAIVRL